MSRSLFVCAAILLACRPEPDTTPPAPTDSGQTVAPTDAAPPARQGLSYPTTARGDVVDTYHGVQVADPYRWLEELDTPDTRAWVEAQNKLTFGYLGGIKERELLRNRLTRLWNYERYGLPNREGGRVFYSKNDGLQNQSVLYVQDPKTPSPRILLDPNTLSADGTVALSGTAISDDGKLLAYGLASAGSDWQEWRVRDVASGQDKPDVIKWVKFASASWTRDGKGFFYSRYDEPASGVMVAKNEFQKLYYHKLGTPQAEDVLIYERKDQAKWGFNADVTDDGRYLVITVWEGSADKNRVFFQDLKPGIGKGKVVELLNNFDAQYGFVGNDGPLFYFQANKDAPRGRLVAIDTRRPNASDAASWTTLVAEAPETLRSVSYVGGQFFLNYLKDARSQIRQVDRKGKPVRDIELPGIGTAYGFGGEKGDKDTYFMFTSYTTPATIYRHDIASGKSEVYRQPKVDFDPAQYEVSQVFYGSKDGTKVPMFLAHKKGLQRDGQNPTYLYGYGGFNVALTPSFSVADITWMEMGGVLAVANLRGGGEYGKDWHEAGTKLRKQNVFDDFIAAAEHLIAEKVTSPQKLAIGGRSNGGLLVGAAITQRPDLFAAAIPGVGVMDMLRFHKFTIGWAWVSDYGSSDDPQEFKALHAYSPLHNLKPGTRYPATLVHTADHDDRVVPGHSYKFAAALQAAQAGDNPVLIRVEVKAGHGAGKPTSKLIEEWVDLWGFLVKNLGMKVG
ncbi:MAG: S9 family peptidase [Myxococcales bacterium]|nr:S9 family peptidase [Myxococcales bacterium]